MRVELSLVACLLGACKAPRNDAVTDAPHSIDSGTSTDAPVIAHGVAQLLHGPSTTTTGSATGASTMTDGRWAISPAQAVVTITALQFQSVDPAVVANVSLTSCQATYAVDTTSLTSLAMCPFEVPAGSYASVTISVSTTLQLLIDDTVNGLYTDPTSPTGLAISPPSGGAQPVTVTVSGVGGSGSTFSQTTYFAQPFTVTAADVSIDLVVDLIHTVFVDVSGGVASFDTTPVLPPVQILPSTTGVNWVAFYSASGSATDVLLRSGSDNDTASVRLLMDGNSVTSYEFCPLMGASQAWAADSGR